MTSAASVVSHRDPPVKTRAHPLADPAELLLDGWNQVERDGVAGIDRSATSDPSCHRLK